jgi:hypothetical protein
LVGSCIPNLVNDDPAHFERVSIGLGIQVRHTLHERVSVKNEVQFSAATAAQQSRVPTSQQARASI